MNPAPAVIAQLAHLVSASMKQLDSAFRHSMTSGVPSTSPLIEYSQSFRTTLLQASQRLHDALRTANYNADKISILAKSSTSNVDNVQRYVARYQKTPNLLFDLIAAPLNRLSESSIENGRLARQVVAGFEGVANLTRAIVDTVATSRQVKENRSNHTDDSMRQLETDISSQNRTIQQLRNETKKHEETFNANFNQQLDMWEIKRNEQPDNKCLADFLRREKSIATDWRGLRSCKIQLSYQERLNYNTFRDANINWRKFMDFVHQEEEKLSKKREEHHQLVLANEALKHEKQRLDQDIDLLSDSVDPLVALGKGMEKLTVGWKKLANLCQIIESDVSVAVITLTNIGRGDAHQMTELAVKLKKTHEDMGLIGKMTGVYVSAYNNHLVDLAVRLEKMVTISDVDPAKLEEDLVNACTEASKKIRSEILAHI